MNLSPEDDHHIKQLIIIFVQGEPNIYKKEDEDYKDNEKRRNSYENVARKTRLNSGFNITGTYLF